MTGFIRIIATADCAWRWAIRRWKCCCRPWERRAGGGPDDIASGGRQMPSHWSHPKLNIVTGSSPTGSQFLQAVGGAEAGRYYQKYPGAAAKVDGDYRQFKDVSFQGDEVVYVSCGDGTTSQGEFWESLSTASNLKLPMLFVVEDNEYAISVPVEVNTPGGNISKVVSGFPNFHFAEVDGTDFLESYAAFQGAIDYVRTGKGPAFVHGHVIRPYSHSLSDDEKLYRPEVERKAEVERDPITRFRKLLLSESIVDEAALHEMELDLTDDVQDAADQAVAAAFPKPNTYLQYLYSPNLDSTSAAFQTEPIPPPLPGKPVGGTKTSARRLTATR